MMELEAGTTPTPPAEPPRSNRLRTALNLAFATFLVVGVLGWVSGMPRPAGTVPYAFAEVASAGVNTQNRATATAGAAPLTAGAGGSATDGIVSAEWLLRTGSLTGIPARALQAYAAASVALQERSPGCELGWNTLAAIAEVESAHGTHNGASIGDGGQTIGSIIGPRLDGKKFQEIVDTDKGVWDRDTEYDRAVGPFQFVPATWLQYGEDASGDGIADPNQIDDAALSAGIYLCSSAQNLAEEGAWTTAVRAYNQDDAYVDGVRAKANEYLALASS